MSVFGKMEVAEREIAAAIERHPAQRAALWPAFRILYSRLPDALYPAYCREILERIAAGQDTRPGTWAECLYVMSETSLEAPLSPLGAGMYARCWRETFGAESLTRLPEGVNLADMERHAKAYSTPDALDSELAQLRKRLTDPNRILAAKQEAQRD